jgi:hypothetical protein
MLTELINDPALNHTQIIQMLTNIHELSEQSFLGIVDIIEFLLAQESFNTTFFTNFFCKLIAMNNQTLISLANLLNSQNQTELFLNILINMGNTLIQQGDVISNMGDMLLIMGNDFYQLFNQLILKANNSADVLIVILNNLNQSIIERQILLIEIQSLKDLINEGCNAEAFLFTLCGNRTTTACVTAYMSGVMGWGIAGVILLVIILLLIFVFIVIALLLYFLRNQYGFDYQKMKYKY